jgi:DsbC/DsbD-like thiol-disulfide interchange protein
MRFSHLLSAVGALLLCSALQAQVEIDPLVRQPARSELVVADLVPDRTSVAPGETFRVAVRFVMQPGWHIYWKNPGDAGTPTVVRWNLPTGFAAPLSNDWPTPRYFSMPGDIRSIGYDNEMAIIATFRAPAEWRGSAPIVAEVQWLACKEQCVPGRATLRTNITVGGATVPINQEFFSRWTARMPQRVELTTTDGPVSIRPVGNTYIVRLREEQEMTQPTIFLSSPPEAAYTSRVREVSGREAVVELARPATARSGAESSEAIITWPGPGGRDRAVLLTLPAQ